MHVLHLEAGRHLYGGPRQVLYLIEGLSGAGVRCSLAAPGGSAIAAAAQAGPALLCPVPLGGDLDLPAIGRLWRLLRALRPDLLHVHSRRGADFFGALAARLAGVPAVLTRRVDNPESAWSAALKYPAYGRIVAISQAVLAQLRARHVPEPKLRLVHSAVDAGAWQPRRTRAGLLAELGLPGDALLVAVVAQLIARKGHAQLLEVWPTVRAACPQARLLLFGAGPLEAALRGRAGHEAGVVFAGFRPDLADFLGHMDLLVHPALAEGLGVALLEAQAAGVPVVACAAGGVPEAIADGQSGLLVRPGDPAALAAAVIGLLGDPGRRAALGAGGRAHVREHFSVPAMTAGYLAIYRELLGAAAPHPGKGAGHDERP